MKSMASPSSKLKTRWEGLEPLRKLRSYETLNRWLIRCKFRTWALLGLQRTHLMPDRMKIDGLLTPGMSYVATTELWKKTIKADTEASHLLLYQWAAYEMLYAAELGISH